MNVAPRPRDFEPAGSLDLISLCTGGGGLDLGVELALPGARSVVMVEREAFAVAHLVAAFRQGLLAPCPVWDDVRTFDGRPWRGLVDGLIGGIPCQPHSLAGRKQGSLDARDLWSDARRHIVTARPWFVLIENVGGMLAAGADEIAGAERVWRDLRKLGFAVEAGLFTAAEVGASHERLRIFILGVADPSNTRSQGSERAGAPGEWLGAPPPRPAAELRAASVADAGLDGRRARDKRDVGAAPQGWTTLIEAPDRAVGNAAWHRGGEGRTLAAVWGRTESAHLDRPSTFPPGPADVDGWRSVLARAPELEPAFRRVADGLASRLDFARIDRLRLLGNGVVPLEAAYAVRTLVTRLAARRAPGAAELARLMEAA